MVVPVTLAPSTVAALDGALIATVQITVGGGAPVTVRLDTGSSGLLLASGAAGPGTTDTGRAVSTEFGGSTASGTLGQAVVELGGVSTAAPIGVTLVDTSAGAPGTFAGTDGMLGVGTGNSSTTAAGDVYAPTLQLPGTAAQGVTLDLTGSGGGTMTLGPVTAPAGATVLPMSRMTGTPATYPNGAVGYDRLVSLCWTVGTAPNACAPTDLDLGNPVFGLNATTFASLGALDTFLPAGQAVSISAPGAAAPLWSTTSAAPASPEALLLTGLGDATYNTGIGLFQRAVVGIDYAAGRFVVQPAG
ncbi:hypothetical protein JL107_04300 [Nakamurella flavida]|uniref:PE cleavage protein A C-terminal domain-containing protein n=1 Tax=Nakamurella flavida TaxID=363630 RepID=A0A939BZF2_9ACTN|nr:hypothetical protein [Nakamurella flavida]MBM9475663.1 hypothetical protein [Nakamurella flavida]